MTHKSPLHRMPLPASALFAISLLAVPAAAAAQEAAPVLPSLPQTTNTAPPSAPTAPIAPTMQAPAPAAVTPSVAAPRLVAPAPEVAAQPAPAEPVQRADAAPARRAAPVERVKPAESVSPKAQRQAAAEKSPSERRTFTPVPNPQEASPAEIADRVETTPLAVQGAGPAAQSPVVPAPEAKPVAQSTETPGVDNGIILGLAWAGIVLVGAGAAVALSRRRRKPEHRAGAVMEPMVAPAMPMATPAVIPVTDAPVGQTPSFASVTVAPDHVHKAEPVARKGAAAKTRSKARAASTHEAMLEDMVAQPPSADNPFLTRTKRLCRASFLMAHDGHMPERQQVPASTVAATPASRPAMQTQRPVQGAVTASKGVDRRRTGTGWNVTFNPATQPG